jgi:hypothetical protein
MVEIRIEGNLDSNWSHWFGAMAISLESTRDCRPITVLTGVVADQAALRGILTKIWDLNLTLISVNPVQNRDGGGEIN